MRAFLKALLLLVNNMQAIECWQVHNNMVAYDENQACFSQFMYLFNDTMTTHNLLKVDLLLIISYMHFPELVQEARE